jgi:glutamyl endopeptidase
MSKQSKWTVSLVGMMCGAAAFVTTIPATAQAQSAHTPVSNDGSTISSPEVRLRVRAAQPYSGTGILSREDAALSIREYAPSPEETRPAASKIESIETVLGFDSRQRVQPTTFYPQRATAYITSSIGSCTGWFAGPDLVVTAGHCVHTGAGGAWATNVVVYPGRNAASSPYGSFLAQSLHSVTGWTVSGDERYDYGAINLSSNIGNTVGWYGYYWQGATLDNSPTIINGYPGDKPAGQQWVGADKVRVTQARQAFYKVDTFGGMSGSPVWEDRPIGSPFCANGPCVYAIHAYGTHGAEPHASNNHGTRIVEAVFNNIVNWVNLP